MSKIISRKTAGNKIKHFNLTIIKVLKHKLCLKAKSQTISNLQQINYLFHSRSLINGSSFIFAIIMFTAI